MGVGCRVGAGTVGAGAGAVGEFQGQNCAAAGAGDEMARKDAAATTAERGAEDNRDMIGNLWWLVQSSKRLKSSQVKSSQVGVANLTRHNDKK